MKNNIKFLVTLVLFVLASCANDASQGVSHSDSQTEQKPIVNDTSTYEKYDHYRFENDTLLQDVYIQYPLMRKVHFIVKSKNKRNSNSCEYSSDAVMANGEGTAQGSDELNSDELYGAYEFFSSGHPFFTLSIEFKRGKRMSIYTKEDGTICKSGCPLSSQGTLRLKEPSKSVQYNPTW